MTKGNFLFLGTGASLGVPVIGCKCPVCLSSNPHNTRLRSSGLLIVGGKYFLIDCGPDFKQQALCYHINHLDGVIFTHAHNDHTAGIDDLKVYSWLSGKPLPCLLSKHTENDIKKRFYYLFETDSEQGLEKRFTWTRLEGAKGEMTFQGLRFSYFSYEQAHTMVNGFKFGDLAYVSDIKHFSNEIFAELKAVNTLILSALRFTPSYMHFNIDEAVDFATKVGAKQTWLMHISHEMDHEKANAYLPENIKLAYDGLQIEFQYGIANT